MNRQITLAARPEGFPVPEDFKLVETPIPEPDEGEVLSRTLFMSVDPYMRGRMNDRASYAANVQIGDVMVGGTVGEVVASNDPGFEVGDIVQAQIGWQAYGVSKGSNLRKVNPDLAPVSTALGVLGMPGLTGVLWIVGCWAAQRRRDCAGDGSCWRCGINSRTNCQDRGLSRCGCGGVGSKDRPCG